MLRLLRFVKSVFLLDSRLKEIEKVQLQERYSIDFEQAGPERHITYREGPKEVNIVADFSWLNDVIVRSDSLRHWANGEPLPDLDFLKVKNRVRSYFECWGGTVTFDETPLPTRDDFAKDLERAAIPYQIQENGIVHYSADIKIERNRKGGLIDRR